MSLNPDQLPEQDRDIEASASGISLPTERGSQRFSGKNLLLLSGGMIGSGVVCALAVVLVGELFLGVPPLTTLTSNTMPMPSWLGVSAMAGGLIGEGVAKNVLRRRNI